MTKAVMRSRQSTYGDKPTLFYCVLPDGSKTGAYRKKLHAIDEAKRKGADVVVGLG